MANFEMAKITINALSGYSKALIIFKKFVARKAMVIKIKDFFNFSEIRPTPQETKMHKSRMAQLLYFACRESLNEEQRNAVYLRLICGESISKTAELLGTNRGVVYRTLESAEKILKQRLQYADAYYELMLYEQQPKETLIPPESNVGDYIRKLRNKKLLSVSQLADILETDENSLSDWEKGKTPDDIILPIRLASFFKIPLDYLREEESDEFIIRRIGQ